MHENINLGEGFCLVEGQFLFYSDIKMNKKMHQPQLNMNHVILLIIIAMDFTGKFYYFF